MSDFKGFTQEDFNIFHIDGLEDRMEALRSTLSPKLESIATDLAPTVSAMTGDEMFVHVAKHARRTTNPPNDTWASLASSKRGYKKLPHFQIGLWESHVFIWFAVIYESPIKDSYARVLKSQIDDIRSSLPEGFVWSKDHTKPDVISNDTLSDESMMALLDRLETVKKAELLCGVTIDRNDPVLQDGEAFLTYAENVLKELNTLYERTKEIQ
ncbi:hypothetical protein N781_12995 [Pontibacillus halophilus JSM 076056 = DSM 19796]|uniref:UPF0637 protein N781_12995 n=1 Tax=Pontibacillus halophilus JSM 076056 = DSM 19796 TaxID=1385510 RepID=A0A0A5GJ82_9BACI|nr:DUF1054 domain-containing protein [Pontibacillus halophilus]KGX93316.1 hypothetical protein N781_12995 [Pontibacillus halophilus JSM 076056 = DSM 19796]